LSESFSAEINKVSSNRSQAFAIVTTGETALYGNILLKKGVITGDD
jgi:L-fucose mutarotase/ribose pyranase (RbsD/FucU family)